MTTIDNSVLNSTLTNAYQTAQSAKLGASTTNAKIDKAAQDFEGMFISQMMNIMFQGVGSDPILGGGSAGKIYQSMMVDQYSKLVSERNVLGISDEIKSSLLKMQEVKTGNHTIDKEKNNDNDTE